MATMTMTLVGRGDVIIFTVPMPDNQPPLSVSISDESFLEGLKALREQAKHHPSSQLRRLRIEHER